MNIIRINNPKYNQWKKRKDYKRFELKLKKKNWKKELNKNNFIPKIDTSRKLVERIPDKIITVPEHFSIINNSKETIEFFDELINLMYSKQKQMIFINMKDIKKITVDALIYLLAVMKNMKEKRLIRKNPVKGNYPENEKAYEIFLRSGFLDYMNYGVEKIDSNDISRIYYGSDYDQDISKKMCCFAHNHSNLTINETDYLYNSICEMMLNTTQHAYESDSVLFKKWYSYAECNPEELIYMFFDTGEGIPSTIERRKKIMGIGQERDSELLSSAMNGDYRTSTKIKTRGSGLGSIKNSVGVNKIIYMSVITNKASNAYEIKNDVIFEKKKDMVGSLTGTLYYWKIRRIVNELNL